LILRLAGTPVPPTDLAQPPEPEGLAELGAFSALEPEDDSELPLSPEDDVLPDPEPDDSEEPEPDSEDDESEDDDSEDDELRPLPLDAAARESVL
jgi:hypothetical protein